MTDALVNFEKILWTWNDDGGEMAGRYKIDKHPLKYMWREILKISWKDIFLFGATIIVLGAVWWALEPHIDEHLVTWTNKWIAPLDQSIAIIAFYTLLAIGFLYIIFNHVRKNAHLRYSGWVLWTLLTIVYSYYRYSPTSPFVFWTIGDWACLDVIYIIDGLFVLLALIYACRVFMFEKKEYYKLSELLRDDAIDNLLEDEFGYDDLVKDLKWRLDSVDITQKAYSVGIAGGWGTGKSSLLNLFVGNQKDSKQIVVQFNPRSAKRADLIQQEFFSVFSNEIGKYSYNARHIVGKYAYALNLHSSTSWIYSIIDLFDDWTAASEKARINDLIRATGKRVYVIIEDLDRLTGSEILEVLKLIDANGNFCHTVFLTAYDKGYVNRVLRQQIGYDESSADFTDKYFQYELPLFKQANQPLQDFFDLGMKVWAQNIWAGNSYQKQLIEDQWPKVRTLLLSHIENMRQTKRYINLFRSSYRLKKARVDFGDCAIVTLIRFLDGKTYHDIFDKHFLKHPGDVFPDVDEWSLSNDFKNESDEQMKELLTYLFDDTEGHSQSEPKYNRICRAESFDNYFHDVIKDKIYANDIDMLMLIEPLDKAIEMFDMFCKNEAGKTSITEYLCKHDVRWIENNERLTRYMQLLVYAHAVIEGLEISRQLNGMLTVNWQAQFEPYISKEDYLECITRAIDTMIPITPFTIGHFFRSRLMARVSHPNSMNDDLVEALNYDYATLEQAQQVYDMQGEKQAWDVEHSIHLGLMVKGEDEKYAKVRARHLMKMMDAKPDEYAKGFIQVEPSSFVLSQSYVKFAPYDGIRDVMSDATLLNWAKSVIDTDLRFIIEYLLKHKNEQGYPNAQLNLSYDEANGAYKRIAEELKKRMG